MLVNCDFVNLSASFVMSNSACFSELGRGDLINSMSDLITWYSSITEVRICSQCRTARWLCYWRMLSASKSHRSTVGCSEECCSFNHVAVLCDHLLPGINCNRTWGLVLYSSMWKPSSQHPYRRRWESYTLKLLCTGVFICFFLPSVVHLSGYGSHPTFHTEFKFKIDRSTNDLVISVYGATGEDELVGTTRWVPIWLSGCFIAGSVPHLHCLQSFTFIRSMCTWFCTCNCRLDFKTVFYYGHVIPLTAYPLKRPSGKAGGHINVSLTFKAVSNYCSLRRNPTLRHRTSLP